MVYVRSSFFFLSPIWFIEHVEMEQNLFEVHNIINNRRRWDAIKWNFRKTRPIITNKLSYHTHISRWKQHFTIAHLNDKRKKIFRILFFFVGQINVVCWSSFTWTSFIISFGFFLLLFNWQCAITANYRKMNDNALRRPKTIELLNQIAVLYVCLLAKRTIQNANFRNQAHSKQLVLAFLFIVCAPRFFFVTLPFGGLSVGWNQNKIVKHCMSENRQKKPCVRHEDSFHFH